MLIVLYLKKSCFYSTQCYSSPLNKIYQRHPLSWPHSSSAGAQNSIELTNQLFLFTLLTQTFLTTRFNLRIAAFCTSMYRAGPRLSSFKRVCIFFWKMFLVDSSNGILDLVLSLHVLTCSSLQVCILMELLDYGSVKILLQGLSTSITCGSLGGFVTYNCVWSIVTVGYAVAQLDEALRHKLGSQGLDSRWGRWDSPLT
jgi:hypothetical protein